MDEIFMNEKTPEIRKSHKSKNFDNQSRNTTNDNYRELLIGCGSSKVKKISVVGREKFSNVTRLDINPDHNPDIVWDLRDHPLPFENDTFDEIHAYEVLEHLAQQGDYKFFFAEFSEYWRILKNKGLFFLSVPDRNSVWAWGDPSHTRIIQVENFVYLDQDEYKRQVGITSISDFRYLYKANFKRGFTEVKDGTLSVVLQAYK
jgi:SAM-dependent methyltransferase